MWEQDDWDFDAGCAEQCAPSIFEEPPVEPTFMSGPDEFESGVPSASSTEPCGTVQLPTLEVPPPAAARKRMRTKGPGCPETQRVTSDMKRALATDEPVPAGVSSILSDSSSVWLGVSITDFAAADLRQKYFMVFKRFRKWLDDFPNGGKGERAAKDMAVDPHVLQAAKQSWKRLARDKKRIVVSAFMSFSHAPNFINEYASSIWAPPGCDDDAAALYARSVLLTWNGPWGLFEGYGDAVQTEAEIVMWCRENQAVQSLWGEAKEYIDALAASIGANVWCGCLEISSSTWHATRVLRVHLHAYFKSDTKKLWLKSMDGLHFHGSVPNKANHINGQSLRVLSSWAGMYYLLAPKKYQVHSFTTKAPFDDFQVSPEWIFNLVQGSKIEYHNAKEQLVRCGKGLTRRLMDLDKWHTARQELDIRARAENVQRVLRAGMATFKEYPAVTDWLAASTAEFLSRKRFLVLTGPSGVGKSEFVRSLFPLGAVMELNCAGLEHVCLVGFNAAEHRCVFWDELSAHVVAANRKIFQHPACWVDLGHSPTGSHVQTYWLNSAVSIVASNRWREDLQAMSSPSDKLWIEANSVVLDVLEPMWLQDVQRNGVGCSGSSALTGS